MQQGCKLWWCNLAATVHVMHRWYICCMGTSFPWVTRWCTVGWYHVHLRNEVASGSTIPNGSANCVHQQDGGSDLTRTHKTWWLKHIVFLKCDLNSGWRNVGNVNEDQLELQIFVYICLLLCDEVGLRYSKILYCWITSISNLHIRYAPWNPINNALHINWLP